MERVKWMESKGKIFLYADYSSLVDEAEAFAVIEEVNRLLKMSPTKVLLLTNYTGSHATKEFMDRMKKAGQETHGMVEKAAVLGIKGIKAVLFTAYTNFTGDKVSKLFDTEEEAIEYLVS